MKFTNNAKRPRWPRIIWTILGTPVLLLVLLTVINLVDQDPSANLAELSLPTYTVEDRDNAYVAALGLGAPAGEDHWVSGQRYLGSLWNTYRQSALVYEAPDRALRFTRLSDLPCRDPNSDCLAEVAGNRDARAAIQAIAKENAVRLDRYHSLYRYPAFVEHRPHAFTLAPPDFYAAGEHRVTLCTIALLVLEGKPEQAIISLSDDIRYWRRVSAGATTLVTKLVAIQSLDNDYRLLSGILRHTASTPSALFKFDAILQPLLLPLSSVEAKFGNALRGEFADFRHFFLTLNAASLPMPLFGSEPRWLDRPLLALFYKPQATINLSASRYRMLLEMAAVPSEEFLDASANSANEDAAWINIYQPGLVYNPIGKTMIGLTTTPTVDYANMFGRIHNLNGYLRLVRMQYEAARAAVSIKDMADFVSDSVYSFSPFSRAPMEWDTEKNEIYFLGLEPKEGSIATSLRVAVRIRD